MLNQRSPPTEVYKLHKVGTNWLACDNSSRSSGCDIKCFCLVQPGITSGDVKLRLQHQQTSNSWRFSGGPLNETNNYKWLVFLGWRRKHPSCYWEHGQSYSLIVSSKYKMKFFSTDRGSKGMEIPNEVGGTCACVQCSSDSIAACFRNRKFQISILFLRLLLATFDVISDWINWNSWRNNKMHNFDHDIFLSSWFFAVWLTSSPNWTEQYFSEFDHVPGCARGFYLEEKSP